MRRFAFLAVLVAFIFSCGGQWPILQGLAWANMIREYSEMVPLAQAVQMTFSGKYPCAMCRAIAEKKNSENTKIAALFQHEKQILPPSLQLARRTPAISAQTFAVKASVLRVRSEAPPVPPPRCA
jgi:hypothetical protein